MKCTETDLKEAMAEYIRKAKSRDEIAAFNGGNSSNEYNAKIVVDHIMGGILFQSDGECPNALVEIVKDIQSQRDPEYNEYIRLKDKFKK